MRHSKFPNVFKGFIVSADHIRGRHFRKADSGRHGRNRKQQFLHVSVLYFFPPTSLNERDVSSERRNLLKPLDSNSDDK